MGSKVTYEGLKLGIGGVALYFVLGSKVTYEGLKQILKKHNLYLEPGSKVTYEGLKHLPIRSCPHSSIPFKGYL